MRPVEKRAERLASCPPTASDTPWLDKNQGVRNGQGPRRACLFPWLLDGQRKEARLLAAIALLTAISPTFGGRAYLWAGGIFAALSAKHIYDRRRML